MDQIDNYFHIENEIPERCRTYADVFFEANNAICQIEEGLFLGSLGDASNKSALKSANVTHILTVSNLSIPQFPNDFVYQLIEVMDREDTNLMRYFDECFSFIDEAKRLGGGVLVHCFMGISRSVTVVVAYLMKKHGMSLCQALAHVKSRRPQASPNSGFILQLQHFEKTLQGKEAEKNKLDLPASFCQSIFSVFNKKSKKTIK